MWHTKNIKDVVKELSSNINKGLSDNSVKALLQSYGENTISKAKKDNIVIKFFKQFNDFMVITLIISAVISALISYFNGSNDYIDAIIILAIVIFNALMGLIQESKAEKSIEALKAMFKPSAKVKRNGNINLVSSNSVVPGDIVILETGSLVPADCRIISSYDLLIDESALTGETTPVSKKADIVLPKDVPLGDTTNMAFASTTVVGGRGEAIVTDTGMHTKVGKIANIIISSEETLTPLQQKLAQIGKILGTGALIVCIIIFIIGSLKKIPLLEMFTTSVGLAVASIPEGLPAIVTILLSIGVTKMAKKNSIIRKLPAVETLGSSTVICSDKTGTLTQNKMTVLDVSENIRETLSLATLCTDCNYLNNTITGNPSEIAIVEFAQKNNIKKSLLTARYPRIAELPFDSKRKLMTTVHTYNNSYLIVTKGAPDVLISKCTHTYTGGRAVPLSNVEKSQILSNNEKMALKSLRVLAVACSTTQILGPINSNNLEKNLTFIGLIGMMDPPRKGVKEAINTCKKAGIKTVMITGDHIVTAKSIAQELGILTANSLAVTGSELDQISDRDLEKNIMKYSVFARVSPEHKVRIVKAFQKNGQVVAMTGDGVNDAPALKNANIGIAMGKIGTDVAKNAADMILADDNFVTITEAVKEGRHIYDNIRKAVHFLISTNMGELLTIFVAIVLGLESPLLAIHLLWINLVTDSFPAIALGMEKTEKNIMLTPPINPKKGIFANGLWKKIIFEGFVISMAVISIYIIGFNNSGIEVARTMAFASLGIIELLHSISVKSNRSIIKSGINFNIYLVGSFILGLILQISVVSVPALTNLFNTVILNNNQWKTVLLISLIPSFVIEVKKLYNDFVKNKNNRVENK